MSTRRLLLRVAEVERDWPFHGSDTMVRRERQQAYRGALEEQIAAKERQAKGQASGAAEAPTFEVRRRCRGTLYRQSELVRLPSKLKTPARVCAHAKQPRNCRRYAVFSSTPSCISAVKHASGGAYPARLGKDPRLGARGNADSRRGHSEPRNFAVQNDVPLGW